MGTWTKQFWVFFSTSPLVKRPVHIYWIVPDLMAIVFLKHLCLFFFFFFLLNWIYTSFSNHIVSFVELIKPTLIFHIPFLWIWIPIIVTDLTPAEKKSDPVEELAFLLSAGIQRSLQLVSLNHDILTIIFLETLICKVPWWLFSLLLLNVLLGCLFSSLGTDAEKTSVGAGHTQAGEGLEVLLILGDNAGLLLLVHLKRGKGWLLSQLFPSSGLIQSSLFNVRWY